MSVRLTVHHDRFEVETVAIGPVTLQDIEAHVREERDAGGLPYREIVDATRATAAFTPGEARTIVANIRELARSYALGPTAIVLSDEMSYGMIRMLDLLLEDVCDVHPFRANEWERAREWVRTIPLRPAPVSS